MLIICICSVSESISPLSVLKHRSYRLHACLVKGDVMGTFLYAAPLDACLLARSLAPSSSTTYGSGSKMRVSVSFRRIPLPPSFPSRPLRGVQIFLCHCHSSANHPQLIIVFVIFLASSVDDGEFSSSSHKTKSSLQHYLNALLLLAGFFPIQRLLRRFRSRTTTTTSPTIISLK